MRPTCASSAPFGRVRVADDGWIVIESPGGDRTPDVVDWVVRHNGRVHAVEDGRRSLEERYLELVGRGPRDAATPPGGGPS